MPNTDPSRNGEQLPLRRTIDDDEIRLEEPRLEQLTAAEEAEATDLLATLFAAAASRRGAQVPLKEAA